MTRLFIKWHHHHFLLKCSNNTVQRDDAMEMPGMKRAERKLVVGNPLWPAKHATPQLYPSLTDDITCDVAVIGGGICGSVIGHSFVSEGLDVVVLEKRRVGQGSSSASTSMLMCELDSTLVELSEMIGVTKASRVYRLCLDYLSRFDELA